MNDAIQVMIELGRKKAVAVASAFDWPGWDRSGKSEEEALQVLAAYRPRYAKVAKLAGLADEFREAGEMAVVERLEGTGMTDFYGLSARSAGPEQDPMSDAACERKIALLRASWTYFDDVASRVSAELREGSARRRARSGQDRLPRKRRRDPRVREEGRRHHATRRLATPRRSPRPPRRVLRGDPRLQRPRGIGADLDGPVRDPALRLPHARPRVGDGGPGSVWRILTSPAAASRTPPCAS